MISSWYILKTQRVVVCFLLMGLLLLATLSVSLNDESNISQQFVTSHPQEAAAVADIDAPSVTITKPTKGLIVLAGTAISVAGTASDNSGGSGISLVEVKVNNGSYVKTTPKIAGDWSTWTASISLPSITGYYQIIAKAMDKAGNAAWFKISVFADITSPSVTISSPKSSSNVLMGSINVIGTASDNSGGGVKVVEVKAGGGSYSVATPRAAGDWSTWTASVNIPAADSHTLTARATDKAGNMQWQNLHIIVSSTSSLDKFGIKKLYPTKVGGNEWYVNMNDPGSDPNFKNLPSMTKQADGSWQVSGGSKGQVRMEAWSPSGGKWLNVEITGYAKMVSGSNELIQWYSRGGHHTSTNECLGSAYKARLYGDGEARWVKEMTHPSYTSNKGSMQATDDPLKGRWVGFKAVIYNFVENGKTYVRMQSYIDDDVTGSNGNLVVKNNWQLASVVEDKGGWSTSNSDFNASCAPSNKDSTKQYRQRDEILNLPGGTSTQNIAAWRSDDLTWNWKYLSVREIAAP